MELAIWSSFQLCLEDIIFPNIIGFVDESSVVTAEGAHQWKNHD